MIDKNSDVWKRKVDDCLSILQNCTPIRTYWVAQELLILAGGDVDLVIQAAKDSPGLDQTKHLILDERLSRIEEDLNYEYEDDDEEIQRPAISD